MVDLFHLQLNGISKKPFDDIDWNSFDDGKKYGRFIYKEEVHMKSEQFGEFIRDKFVVHNAWLLRDENGKKNFEKLSKIPQK